MMIAKGHHGSTNEVLFEQRTPSTLRGYLNLTLSPAGTHSFPRNVVWRLRIGEGSTMLCSKLCGLMTVRSPEDAPEEKISITLAVRTGSSSSLQGNAPSQPMGDEPVANGLPPLGNLPAQQIPAWVRKTSKLKVQWIELSQVSTPRQTQQSLVLGNDGITLDVGTAQRALQTATKDRSLLESMFRIAGHRVQSLDIGCTFSESPLSARGTSRFSSMRSIATEISELSSTRGDRTVVSREASPARSPTHRRVLPPQAQKEVSPVEVPELSASVASQRPPFYLKPFWIGFIVGCTFGVTGVFTMLGQTGQLTRLLEQRGKLVMRCGVCVKESIFRNATQAQQYGYALARQLAAYVRPLQNTTVKV